MDVEGKIGETERKASGSGGEWKRMADNTGAGGVENAPGTTRTGQRGSSRGGGSVVKFKRWMKNMAEREESSSRARNGKTRVPRGSQPREV